MVRFAGEWHTSAGVRAGYVPFSFKAALKQFHLVQRKRESCLVSDLMLWLSLVVLAGWGKLFMMKIFCLPLLTVGWVDVMWSNNSYTSLS